MKDGLSVPVWATALGWSVAIVFLGSYFFVAHAMMRGLVPAFGWNLGAMATATFGTIAMGLGVIWFVALAELPEIWFIHRRPHRLIRQGRCPGCGHATREAGVDRCGECGIETTWLPDSYVFGWNAARRFGIALILGFFVGLIAAEVSIAVDEHRMHAAIETLTNGNPATPASEVEMTIAFGRAWPASFARVEWTPQHGFRPEQMFPANGGERRDSNASRDPTK